jgi:hypothetical protein
MNSSSRKQHSKPIAVKGSGTPGKKYILREKAMSLIARLMATFYGIEQK